MSDATNNRQLGDENSKIDGSNVSYQFGITQQKPSKSYSEDDLENLFEAKHQLKLLYKHLDEYDPVLKDRITQLMSDEFALQNVKMLEKLNEDYKNEKEARKHENDSFISSKQLEFSKFLKEGMDQVNQEITDAYRNRDKDAMRKCRIEQQKLLNDGTLVTSQYFYVKKISDDLQTRFNDIVCGSSEAVALTNEYLQGDLNEHARDIIKKRSWYAVIFGSLAIGVAAGAVEYGFCPVICSTVWGAAWVTVPIVIIGIPVVICLGGTYWKRYNQKKLKEKLDNLVKDVCQKSGFMDKEEIDKTLDSITIKYNGNA